MASHGMVPGPIPEPTYRMAPSEDEKFYPSRIEELIHSVCADFFRDKVEYDASMAEEWSQSLSSRLLSAVTQTQHVPRYKLIVQVTILQENGQGVTISSKSLCDVSFDSWASCTFRTKALVCSAMVFGFYHE
ncbi:tctex1 domain-containing protein 3 [Cyclospora cayetanensis]|uniref:Tctex-1 family protein n=2 Tax=Cyclospora cayetanensis TaxID=88456 RepID=A0A1D3D174_9EIME|nr:tctex1 domain-containing protein 3 [Cyclospora cayetanensis]OEH77207.1 tctex-1 family protein [Cyclospora cayetanensis]